MALTLFLFKVSNLNISKSKSEVIVENEDQSTTDTTQFITDENTILLSAKVIFRGIYFTPIRFYSLEISYFIHLEYPLFLTKCVEISYLRGEFSFTLSVSLS
jgi:hypothetical protein